MPCCLRHSCSQQERRISRVWLPDFQEIKVWANITKGKQFRRLTPFLRRIEPAMCWFVSPDQVLILSRLLLDVQTRKNGRVNLEPEVFCLKAYLEVIFDEGPTIHIAIVSWVVWWNTTPRGGVVFRDRAPNRNVLGCADQGVINTEWIVLLDYVRSCLTHTLRLFDPVKPNTYWRNTMPQLSPI